MASLPREPYIPETERLSADEMDEQRRDQMAYEYLLRLEEARGWISECLNMDLPPPVELEESLRNGVLLGRMANYFASDIVSERRVFDITEDRYKSQGLHFRHTDNIMQWIRAMRHTGLPEVFIPDTTDVYDKKNMPKAIFCIHALSLYLYRRGLAPPMRDVSGNVAFTKEEISMIAEALAQQGIRLPPFSKIGGMLAEELSKDEAELHAAVVAINDAIDSGDPEKTFQQLKNTSAQLNFVLHSNADPYQDSLFEEKCVKTARATADPQLGDLYDRILSRHEIQSTIDTTNETIAMDRLNAALTEGTPQTTLQALQDPILRFPRVWPAADSLYYQELRTMKKQKAADVTSQETFSAVKVLNSVVEVNQSLDSEEVESLWNALTNPHLEMRNLEPENCSRYLYRMRAAREEKGEGSCRYLNWSELEQCITDANQPLSAEEKRAETLAKLQDAIQRGDTVVLLELLNHPCGLLSNVQPSNIDAYAETFKKAGNGFLSFEEIQNIIFQTNVEVSEGREVGAAVSDVNCALNEDASPEMLCELLIRYSGILGIETDRQIAPEYQKNLKNAQEEKKNSSAEKAVGLWVPYHTPSGLNMFIKDDEFHEVRFSDPHEPLCNWYLNGDEIRSEVKSANEATNDLSYSASATVIQSKFRSWSQRRKYLDNKQHYINRTGDVVKTQAQVRMWLCRKEYLKRLAYLRQQDAPVSKIQKFFRRKQSMKDYQALTQSDTPSLKVVRKFATLVLQTELDYEEEIEIQTLKTTVARQARSSKKLEEDLNVMDLKIGLLVKNRLGVEEVLLHGQRLSSHQRLSSASEDMNGNRPRSLSKTSEGRLESYQQLLYILQTEPQYFTRLLLHMSASQKVTRLVDAVIFPLFNFAMQRREEYLMLRLLKTAMVEEIRTKVQSLADVTQGETLVSKIVVTFTRHLHGEALLKQMLEPVIQDLLSEKKKELNTNPLEIYRYYVGEPPEEMEQEEAALHPEVAPVFEASLSYVANWAGAFVDAVASNVDHLPYGLRYMAKVMQGALKEKFYMFPEKDIIKAVGHLVYNQYINPSLASPDQLGILDSSTSETTVSEDDRKKLLSIAKLLEYSAVNMGFGGENAYLAPWNDCIKDLHESLKEYFIKLTLVPEPENVFGMDKYSEYTMAVKPVVLLTLGDVAFLHQVLLENKSVVVPSKDDTVNLILRKLGSKPPKVEDLAGILTDENQVHKADIGQTEVKIELDPQFRPPMEEDEESSERHLFLQTKKYVLDVILCQQGDTLPEVLSIPSSKEQEESHQKLQMDAKLRRKAQNLQLSGAEDEEELNLEAKKQRIRENLNKLENRNLVSSSDGYQAVVSAIATDIKAESKHRDRRKGEIARLKDILKRMDEKRNYQNEQIKAYNQYIQGCLENLAPKSAKRRSIQLDSKKSTKRQSENSELSKSVKYTGERFAKKGVLMGIEGIPENQLKNVTVEIETGSAPGVFDVHIKKSDGDPERMEMVLQELLKLQYEGSDEITLGKAVFRLDELIFFLNKKFYCS